MESLVNIIPVIVKVDCLCVDELKTVKTTIKESLEKNTSVYQSPIYKNMKGGEFMSEDIKVIY